MGHASMAHALAPLDGLVAIVRAKRAPKTALATVHARMVFVHVCGRTLGRLAMTTTAVPAPLCVALTVALQNAVPSRPRAPRPTPPATRIAMFNARPST